MQNCTALLEHKTFLKKTINKFDEAFNSYDSNCQNGGNAWKPNAHNLTGVSKGLNLPQSELLVKHLWGDKALSTSYSGLSENVNIHFW